jgi:hypothetical protein
MRIDSTDVFVIPSVVFTLAVVTGLLPSLTGWPFWFCCVVGFAPGAMLGLIIGHVLGLAVSVVIHLVTSRGGREED